MLEGLLAEQTNRPRPDDDHEVRIEGPRQTDDVNAVGQRFGYGGGLGGKRFGPGDQTSFGSGDILGESAVPPVIPARNAKNLPVVA